MLICLIKKFCAVVLFFMVAGPAAAEGRGEIPFQAGERMVFQVRWAFIPAGEAVLEVLPHEEINGCPARRFGLKAYTYPAVDIFYKVRDHIDAYTDMDMTRTIKYTRKTDGKRSREERVVIDQEAGKAWYTNFGQGRDPVPVLPGTFDPFSVFYAFRLEQLREGKEMTYPVTDGKRVVESRANVTRRANIETRFGRIETFLVELSMEKIEGSFEKPDGAGIQIWVSADEHRVPVRVRSKVPVGSFVAELTEISGSDWPHRDAGDRREKDDMWMAP